MIIEEAIFSHLSNDPRLSIQVVGRIYPLKLPQDYSLPAITYQEIGGGQISRFLGNSTQSPQFQFSVWSDDYIEAKEITKLIRETLNGFSGVMGGDSGVSIIACQFDSIQDIYDSDMNIYRVSIVFQIWYEEF
jgi:hypothetical protein